ncbi:MAG: aminoglycoside phosphotransferase [Gammaproteobacteria bacterium]|nr:aminoglycoside phosphotransferase [Gammaproteobacteria bacterium]
MGVTDASDSRLEALTRWVVDDLGFGGSRIEPASADASFRRYFRVTRDADSCIVMDAPPDKENVAPYIRFARFLAGMGLNVPIILARDVSQGFLLLSDLGSRQYLDELKAGREVERLYADALEALVIMQTAGGSAAGALPAYDRALLLREMELLPEWFLGRHLGLPVADHDRGILDRLFDALARAALSQPSVFVHRDYHSRNLLLTDEDNPGILDFQDAVVGPVTYDAVSLLKDCYIAWPEARVRDWLLAYRDRLGRAGIAVGGDAAEFVRWFDLMGMQRHIKVLGIFARLYYRDGKPGYLKDLPRVLDYTRATAAAYPETAEFAEYVTRCIDPAFAAAQRRAGA